MHPYPHVYQSSAAGGATGSVAVTSPSLPLITSTSPPQFDGPEGNWSPETLLCAAAADCFLLTFRAVSRAAHFEWANLECRVEGTLDRVERQARFTRFVTFATLTVAPGADLAKARSLLERAEQVCLIANSLSGERAVQIELVERA